MTPPPVKYQIILEGVDCVGKTSILNKLKDVYENAIIIKQNRPFETKINVLDNIQEDAKTLYKYRILKENRPILYDRMTMTSELVYGKLLRKNKIINLPEIFDITDANLFKSPTNKHFNSKLVILVDEPNNIIKRFDNKHIKIEDIANIQHEYIRLYSEVKKQRHSDKVKLFSLMSEEKFEELYGDLKIKDVKFTHRKLLTLDLLEEMRGKKYETQEWETYRS
jgi:hypothetical protein